VVTSADLKPHLLLCEINVDMSLVVKLSMGSSSGSGGKTKSSILRWDRDPDHQLGQNSTGGAERARYCCGYAKQKISRYRRISAYLCDA
jgi:hypothetical protein